MKERQHLPFFFHLKKDNSFQILS